MGRVFSYCRCSTTRQFREKDRDSFQRQEQPRPIGAGHGVELTHGSVRSGRVGLPREEPGKGGGLNRFLEMAKSGQLGENPVY